MPDTHRILLGGSKLVASFAPYEYGDNQGKGGRVILTDNCVEVEIHGTWEELARLVNYTAISFSESRRKFDVPKSLNDRDELHWYLTRLTD